MLPQKLLRFAAVTIFAAGIGTAHAADPAPVDAKELAAKLQYCTSCHQRAGQGYNGANPVPRLAGQQPEYFEAQLNAFLERRRENNFMFKVVHGMSPGLRAAIAAHFFKLNPKPVGVAPRDNLAEGKKIFNEGVASANVPACATCHGPEAKGIGVMPRLAGQLYPYILKALKNWDKERGQDPKNPDNSSLMQPIAHNLTAAQISAVAAYLNFAE
jgi:cytochrome c553